MDRTLGGSLSPPDITVADTKSETEIVPQIPFLSFRAEKQHLNKKLP